MGEVSKVKAQLTGAEKSIDNARSLVEGMADRVRGQLAEIDALASAGSSGAGDADDQLELG
jgi:hypothetical protein